MGLAARVTINKWHDKEKLAHDWHITCALNRHKGRASR
jgi:hypothetical protein